MPLVLVACAALTIKDCGTCRRQSSAGKVGDGSCVRLMCFEHHFFIDHHRENGRGQVVFSVVSLSSVTYKK